VAYLTLTEDEIALLRFTCDLFFVEESPLFYLEGDARGPDDFEDIYRSLVERGIVDPDGFRITDESLNRIAPITECDGRIVHIRHDAGGDSDEADFYLLDEIAVPYMREGAVHALGNDMDPDELFDYLGRRLEPRRADGDVLSFELSSAAFTALGAISRALRDGHDPVFSTSEVATAVDGAPASSATRLERPLRVARTQPAVDPRAALRELELAEVVTVDDDRVTVRPAVAEFALALDVSRRETFVRYDFGDDSWATREVTLIPVDRGLYSIAPTGSGIAVRELDAAALKQTFIDVLGPLPQADGDGPPRRLLRELLLAVDEDDAEDPTLVMR
jgi:hypothetical protein